MATSRITPDLSTVLADEMRSTLSDHSESIAQLRADVGILHRDNSDVKGTLSDIKGTLQTILAREEAQPQKPTFPSILSMVVSAFFVIGFLIGGLKYFINSEVEASKLLLEYRVAHIEASMSWTPSLVSVQGGALRGMR